MSSTAASQLTPTPPGGVTLKCPCTPLVQLGGLVSIRFAPYSCTRKNFCLSVAAMSPTEMTVPGFDLPERIVCQLIRFVLDWMTYITAFEPLCSCSLNVTLLPAGAGTIGTNFKEVWAAKRCQSGTAAITAPMTARN